MKLNEIIEEIVNYQNTSKHKSALDIHRLLDANKQLFSQKMDTSDFAPLLTGFETLAYADPKEYATSSYQNDYERLYGLLLYHLNKIV